MKISPKINKIEFKSRFRLIIIDSLLEKSRFTELRSNFPDDKYFRDKNKFAWSLRSNQSEFDDFKEMLDKIGVKAPSVSPSKAKTPEELAEIMMGIDRTAKVHLPKDEKVVQFPCSSTGPEMIVDGSHRSQSEYDGLDLYTSVDMTVDFSYDENIFSEDNDFSEYQYIIKENQEETKNE